jgi:membrane protein YdbS with pleckstrin-like domain
MDQPRNVQSVSRDAAPASRPVIGEIPASMQTQAGERGQAAAQPEQDLWSGRMHWQNGIGRVIFWLLLNVAAAVGAYYLPKRDWLSQRTLVWIVLGFFALTTLFILGGLIVRMLQTRYRLSSQRLFIERGILSRTMDQTELIRVDDVRMQQTFINRIFNIGTVLLMTTDMTDRSVAIIGIKEPVRVTELIRQQMRTLRGKSLFVENL